MVKRFFYFPTAPTKHLHRAPETKMGLLPLVALLSSIGKPFADTRINELF